MWVERLHPLIRIDSNFDILLFFFFFFFHYLGEHMYMLLRGCLDFLISITHNPQSVDPKCQCLFERPNLVIYPSLNFLDFKRWESEFGNKFLEFLKTKTWVMMAFCVIFSKYWGPQLDNVTSVFRLHVPTLCFQWL